LFVFVTTLLSSAWLASASQVPIAPGPLSRAHSTLEGVANCSKCHDPGQELSAARCLSCHKPIAERIARKSGVHREVTGNCNACHLEHRGADTDLRQIDTRSFNHAAETGFVLENRHAKLATNCAACHKKRTFLDARPACDSCHKDVHKGTLGTDCTKCHSTEVVFKDARRSFNHARSAFQLTGAHQRVACEKCHASGVLRGLRFDSCSSCHKTPHRNELGPSCTSCHTTNSWATRTIEHAKTGFALAGAHQPLACAKCHTSGVKTALRFDTCSACHMNVHRDSVKDDCRKCHTEVSFRGAKFDHAARTRFALSGKHEPLACRKCHTGIAADDVPMARKVIDFGGASPACVTCHKDHHKGDFGRTCDACHRADTFKAAGFTHQRSPEFHAGRHAGVACVKCHTSPADIQAGRAGLPAVPPRAKSPAMACDTCHADPHLGQVGAACERCHAIEAAKFAPARFSHETAVFKLSGRHRTVECIKCHPSETRAFPAGAGTAKRLKAISSECHTCHKDPHLGQVDTQCTTCHSAVSFKLLAYTHRGMDDFFTGFHGRLPCRSCHKTETGQFPAGHGTAMRFKLGRTCAACHPYI
jgi:Cytochrome c7 and related cytochrome c